MNSSVSDSQLGRCSAGFSGVVTGFLSPSDIDGENRIDRLREMGFEEGLDVEILHQNPFGKDPIAVRIGSMTIALRRSEANLIEVSAA